MSRRTLSARRVGPYKADRGGREKPRWAVDCRSGTPRGRPLQSKPKYSHKTGGGGCPAFLDVRRPSPTRQKEVFASKRGEWVTNVCGRSKLRPYMEAGFFEVIREFAR